MRVRKSIPALVALASLGAAASAVPAVSEASAAPKSTVSASAASSAKKQHHRVPVIAHRGASRVAPEETLAAYREAIAQRADVLEGDVQLTKDRQMVLVHDDTLERTTNVEEVFPDRAKARVGEFTLAEIKQLDAGSWFLPQFADQKVPTVAEVLDIVDTRKVGVTLELKAAEHSPGVATLLAEELAKRGLVDDSRTKGGDYRVMVHSRDKDALREFAGRLPRVPLVYLTGGPMLSDEELKELSTWTMGVFSDPRRTTADDIARAHAAQIEVYCDPVDSPEQIDMALEQGYDHLVTNVPDIARAVRDGRKNPERNANGVVVDHIVSNPPGDDMQYEHNEYVALRNTTSRPIDLGGHSLIDNGGTRLVIPEGKVIQPGSLFRVHVGDGPDAPNLAYAKNPRGILNNTIGETIFYYDDEHDLVDVHGVILGDQ